MQLIVISLLVVLSGTVFGANEVDADKAKQSSSFWDDRERGYYFYEDPVVEKKKKKKKPEEKPTVSASAPEAKPLTAREILRKDGEEMEEIFARMQLEPTPENIHAYIEKVRAISTRSYDAAMAYGDEMFFVPGLDTTPKGMYAPTVYEASLEEERLLNEKIMANNDKYSLVFFMRSDCNYCKEFAPILKMVAEETGFHVLPVSLDGGGLGEFPDVVVNEKLVKKAGIKAVPAVYLLNPKNKKLQAVSHGFKGHSDFKDQFARAFDYIEKHGRKL